MKETPVIASWKLPVKNFQKNSVHMMAALLTEKFAFPGHPVGGYLYFWASDIWSSHSREFRDIIPSYLLGSAQNMPGGLTWHAQQHRDSLQLLWNQ